MQFSSFVFVLCAFLRNDVRVHLPSDACLPTALSFCGGFPRFPVPSVGICWGFCLQGLGVATCWSLLCSCLLYVFERVDYSCESCRNGLASSSATCVGSVSRSAERLLSLAWVGLSCFLHTWSVRWNSKRCRCYRVRCCLYAWFYKHFSALLWDLRGDSCASPSLAQFC